MVSSKEGIVSRSHANLAAIGSMYKTTLKETQLIVQVEV
jgi:hypothetical protein